MQRFNPGDIVQLTTDAACANIRNNGEMFPGIDDESLMIVWAQRGAAVLVDQLEYTINERWLTKIGGSV